MYMYVIDNKLYSILFYSILNINGRSMQDQSGEKQCIVSTERGKSEKKKNLMAGMEM